jgi:hypothetical protein
MGEGEGSGGGAKSYDSEKAWSSIIIQNSVCGISGVGVKLRTCKNEHRINIHSVKHCEAPILVLFTWV